MIISLNSISQTVKKKTFLNAEAAHNIISYSLLAIIVIVIVEKNLCLHLVKKKIPHTGDTKSFNR